ncbi:MAG: cation:proton antiporter [Bacteroidales bacterium]
MLTSFALIFLLALSLSSIFKKINLPPLFGMLLTGIILGPYTLNLIDSSLLSISPDLRKLALVIILTRAGLALDLNDLKKVGRPAILMSFLPACLEIIGITWLAPKILGISLLEAALMGTVVAAVSPAIIVPKMLFLMERKIGTKKGIPQMIMASGSVDDVFVIVLFTAFTSLLQGDSVTAGTLFKIPVSMITGIAGGALLGLSLNLFFRNYHMRDSVKVLILLSFSFLFITIENKLENLIPFSGLLAIMTNGAILYMKYQPLAIRLSSKFSKIWVVAEIILFGLVGASVDLSFAFEAGASVFLLVILAMLFRMTGVFLSMSNTDLNFKERLFCMIAFLPKATVQAAIGSIPLTLGMPCGNIILTVAVLAILITAPLGALGIDLTYGPLLCGLNRKQTS